MKSEIDKIINEYILNNYNEKLYRIYSDSELSDNATALLHELKERISISHLEILSLGVEFDVGGAITWSEWSYIQDQAIKQSRLFNYLKNKKFSTIH